MQKSPHVILLPLFLCMLFSAILIYYFHSDFVPFHHFILGFVPLFSSIRFNSIFPLKLFSIWDPYAERERERPSKNFRLKGAKIWYEVSQGLKPKVVFLCPSRSAACFSEGRQH
ncbi:uncharacterized protein LOC133740489 [Rosa rugosa]|uniref:uncharacterized protein LOC133740489 n=1 Tax=Rosa rugosa TaxID=74645 RepID=UPI002B406638|nr:uncharacterized protein LOC133740489 [Rosa rugosa]